MHDNINNIINFCLPFGFTLKDYQIVSVLGQGGFGVTYKAKDVKTEKFVVIKEHFPQDLAARVQVSYQVIPKNSTSETEYQRSLNSFLREAETIAQFSHTNIIQIIDYFEILGTAYYVMPFYEGQTLAEKLAKAPQGKTTTQEVLTWLPPILSALQAIHAQGILHRDLKPENIFFKTINQPVLIDFGSARNALTATLPTTVVVITPGFSPPEQYSRLISTQGPWTDVYALAAVIYNCLTGEIPATAAARQAAVAENEPDPLAAKLSVLAKENHPALIAALEKSLKLVRKKRIQGIKQFSEALNPLWPEARLKEDPASALKEESENLPIITTAELEQAATKDASQAQKSELGNADYQSLAQSKVLLTLNKSFIDKNTKEVNDLYINKYLKIKNNALLLSIFSYLIYRITNYSYEILVQLELIYNFFIHEYSYTVDLQLYFSYLIVIIVVYVFVILTFLNTSKLFIGLIDLCALIDLFYLTYFINRINNENIYFLYIDIIDKLVFLLISFTVSIYIHTSRQLTNIFK
ncbi:MAG: serine/threonine protein kinase [Deltaproteobacteria bacterium]|jgi:serine/threonine protein kinase|nr:serine/threonine protein kinase [Deltaproteobacteria bacterium]